MKITILLTALVWLFSHPSSAQDVLKFVNGSEKIVKILSKQGTKIEYKDFYSDNLPSVIINKNEILYVQHPDGKKEYFETAVETPVTTTTIIVEKEKPVISSPTTSINTTELSKGLDKINNQLKDATKSEEQLLKQILEALNNLNANVVSLKASVDTRPLSNIAPNTIAYNNTNQPTNSQPVRSNPVHETPKPQLIINVDDDSKKTALPELDNIPYQLKNNEFILLDRTEGAIDNKMKGLYGGNETNVKAFGQASKVRFSSSAQPKIFIHFDTKVDPSEKIWLLKGEVVKDGRRFLCASTSISGAARDASSSRIDVEFKKIADNFYEIVIPLLQSGEYAFTAPVSGMSLLSSLGGGGSSNSSKISCFGIDGANTTGTPNTQQRPKDPIGGAIYDDIQKKKAEGN